MPTWEPDCDCNICQAGLRPTRRSLVDWRATLGLIAALAGMCLIVGIGELIR